MALQKVLAETNNYRIFLNLCEQLVQINKKICDLRGILKIIDKSEVWRCFSSINKLAYKCNEPCLYIQYEPPSSISFWKNIGFTLIERNASNNYIE